jgi:hypothetical protein
MKRKCFNIAFVPLLLLLMGFDFNDTFTLPSKMEKEECSELVSGTIFSYEFNTSLPVDFNLHGHTKNGGDVKLDEVDAITSRQAQSVKINQDGVYCLTWENRNNENLEVRYKIHFNDL